MDNYLCWLDLIFRTERYKKFYNNVLFDCSYLNNMQFEKSLKHL